MRFLVIAKPWSGGLGRYIYRTLDDVFPGRVTWVPTYPETWIQRIVYQRDKGRWRRAIVDRINAARYCAAVFVNHLEVFRALRAREQNLLWATDGPHFEAEDLAPYGQVFVSDSGYSERTAVVAKTGQFGGEVGFACYPRIHTPFKGLARRKGICFIGNHDRARTPYLAYLLARKLDLRVYGNHFLRSSLHYRHPLTFRSSVSNSGQAQIYARFRASLNIHAAVVREGTNMRTFECAAYGMPQIVDHRPGLERYFEADREIAVSSSPEEMLQRCRWLLSNPAAGAEMAARAQARVLAEHTYGHRLARMLRGVIAAKEIERLLRVAA